MKTNLTQKRNRIIAQWRALLVELLKYNAFTQKIKYDRIVANISALSREINRLNNKISGGKYYDYSSSRRQRNNIQR